MAALLNKWLFVSVIPVFFSLSGVQEKESKPAHQARTASLHPFHVSVVEVNFNASEQTLEISCKIFTDDFEKVLAQNYKTKTDLINPPVKKVMDSLVKKYIGAHLSIRTDGKSMPLAYLGFEHENDAVYGYVYIDHVTSVKKIGISNKLMHDLFDDQINIMHVTINGKRKSTRLNYPASDAEFDFSN